MAYFSTLTVLVDVYVPCCCDRHNSLSLSLSLSLSPSPLPFSAIHRNAHAPRSRTIEAEEASIVLSTVQSQFSHYAIEYAYQLNLVKVGKGHQILDNVSVHGE